MTSESAAGARETVLHAVRAQRKANLLIEQARASIEVAAGLQHHLSEEEYDQLVALVRETNISPRRAFTTARDKERNQRRKKQLYTPYPIGSTIDVVATWIRPHEVHERCTQEGCQVAGCEWWPGMGYHAHLTGRMSYERHFASPPLWPRGEHVVYLLFDETGLCIYIGVSSHLKSRIQGHNAKPWTRCHVIICATRREAEHLEGDLIYQHQPPLNVADRRRRRTA